MKWFPVTGSWSCCFHGFFVISEVKQRLRSVRTIYNCLNASLSRTPQLHMSCTYFIMSLYRIR